MTHYIAADRKSHHVVSTNSTPDIVMVFIGETGSGKSTCINYFANYFTNSSFNRRNHYTNMKVVISNHLFPKPDFIASMQQHSERDVYDNTLSQTQDCIAYDFVHNGNNIKIIDTPGFNDTDSKKDGQNLQSILKKISQLPFINAIIITINGTNTRLSTSTKTTLTQLHGSLPDSVFNNLIFVFTNCTEDTRNFDEILISEFNPSSERTFHMQNSLFSITDMSILYNDRIVRRMEETWQESFKTMSEIMDRINQMSASSVQEFEYMRAYREQLHVYKENLIEKQKSLLNIMEQLDIEKIRLQDAKSDRQANRNFTKEKTIRVIEIERKPYYSTLCVQHGNVQVCHENSSLSYQPNLNFDHFKSSPVADGDNCRHCKCSMNNHLHSYEIPVSRYKTIDEIIQSKKLAYEKAIRDVRTSNIRLNVLDASRIAYEDDITKIKNDLINTMRELRQICSNFNFLDEMKDTIEKLRTEAKITMDIRAKEKFNDTADAIERASTISRNRYSDRHRRFVP